MDSFQSILFRLLCELDDICERNGIEYCLGGETALCAARWGGYCADCHSASILLDSENFNRLDQVMRKGLPQNRAFEAISTNAKFPLANAMYVDASTTDLDLRTYNLVDSPGVGVAICRIVPFSQQSERSTKAWIDLNSRIERRFNNAYYLTAPQSSTRESFLDRCVGLLRDREIYSPSLLRGSELADRVFVLQYRRNMASFPIELFEEYVPSQLEGRRFWLPVGYSEYLNALFGTTWMEREFHFSHESSYRIVDLRQSYDAYREAIERQKPVLKEFWHVSKVILPISAERNRMRCEVEKIRHMPERTADRFLMSDSLLPQKDKMLALYRDARFAELDEMLAEYRAIAIKHLRNDVPFAFDKDYYYALCDVLNWRGCLRTRRRLLEMRGSAFSYLDGIAPDNEFVLGGSPFRFVAAERAFYPKEGNCEVCFGRNHSLPSDAGAAVSLPDDSASSRDDSSLVDDE